MTNSELPPMADIELWIDFHGAELRELADCVGVHADTVRFLATLVLGGSSDAEIYEHLRELVRSPDGQHSPLAGAPELLRDVRNLAETS
jgi:hypothetical protein